MCTYILVLLFVLYLVFLVIATLKISDIAVHPVGHDYEQEIDFLKSFGYDCNEFLDSAPCEDFVCDSDYGYQIHGRLFRLDVSKKAVLLCHGYGGNSTTMLSYARLFRNYGFNVVVYDHRNFGINEKSFTSFGYYESKDLLKVYDYVRTLFDDDTEWGVMGESMGAATMLLALPEMKDLKFAIDDCGYAEMKTELKVKCPIPSLGAISLCDLVFKSRYGFSMKQVQPYLSIRNVSPNLPMLFIYSKTDKIVPFRMFDMIYNGKKGKKECFVVDDCRHAKVIFRYTKEYEKKLGEFFKKYKI